jgi:predicted Zn-dependent peptidase
MKTEIGTLPNGIRTIAVPMKERRSVSIGIWVHVGGRDEEPRLNGVSHFLEHIVFKGTKTRTANQIKETVEGSGGSLNDAAIADADVEKERQVIIEEIKMTQDQPAQHAEEILAEIMWPGHALGRPLTGTVETVSAFTRQDLVDYRDAHYNPGLVTVVAAGDVDAKRLADASARAFANVRKPASKSLGLFGGPQGKSTVRVFRKPTEQTHLALGLRTFGKEHADEYALDILATILGGNMSSRLFNEVREERGLCYDIGASVRKYHETGGFVVSAGVDAKKLREALEVTLAELRKIAAAAPGADELRRAKEFAVCQLDLSLENTMNAMLWAGESMVSLGRVRAPEEVFAAVERVSAEDVSRVAAGLFRGKPLDLAVVGPVADGAERELSELLAS